MARQTDMTGNRHGDWVVMSRAKPQGGKRFWNVTNSVTDAQAVVAQTELKNLAGKACVADENCTIKDGKHAMPSSAEITAKVVVGNHANDPFNIPDGILPDDDSEYPFAPEFTEPAFVPVKGEVADNPFEVSGQMDFDFPDDDECSVADCKCEPNIVKFTGPGFGADLVVAVNAEETKARANKLIEALVDAMVVNLRGFIDEWRDGVIKELSERIQVTDAS